MTKDLTKDEYIRPILVTLLITTLPHVIKLPMWITFWCLLMWGYSAAALKYNLPVPGKWIRHILTAIGFIGILLTFGRRSGGAAYIGLLAIMAGLKPFEITTHRDRMVTMFIAYFIIISNLLNSESLVMTVYLFPSVVITTAVLIHINHPTSPLKNKIRLASQMMIQAIPFTIILFFMFPRLQESIWGMAREATGISGFSDYLFPGTVTDLVRSNETAFKAEFSARIPEPDQLYWRGIVFDQFDGKGWRRKRSFFTRMTPVTGKDETEYVISLEPHDRIWVFALDLPVNPPYIARIMADHTLMAYRRLTQRTRYTVRSYLSYNTGPWQRWESANLDIPETGNLRARRLAEQWKNNSASPEDIAAAALTYFKENGFSYTLNPQILKGDFIDDFLFNTRKGYCEHYASAFAFLMRAAGVPARVVGGYLGGELNPYGNFLLVRQSDAHAWNEIWLSNQGWVRVDPTAVVSPQRIRGGVVEALAPDELPEFLSMKRFGRFSDYWKEIRYGWDAINNQWEIWFMGFSSDQQKKMLANIGIKDREWKGIIQIVLLTGSLLCLMSAVVLWIHFQKKKMPKDEALDLYHQFCEKMAAIGLPKKPYAGPKDYADYILSQRNDLEPVVLPVIQLYIDNRYGNKRSRQSLKELKARIRSLI